MDAFDFDLQKQCTVHVQEIKEGPMTGTTVVRTHVCLSRDEFVSNHEIISAKRGEDTILRDTERKLRRLLYMDLYWPLAPVLSEVVQLLRADHFPLQQKALDMLNGALEAVEHQGATYRTVI